MNNTKFAMALELRLRRIGFDVEAARVRYLEEDPTVGDEDWRGPGFYFGDFVDIACAGVTKSQAIAAVKVLVQIRTRAQKEERRAGRRIAREIRARSSKEARAEKLACWKAGEPERRAKALRTLGDVLGILREHGPGMVGMALGVGDQIRTAMTTREGRSET